MTCLNKATSGFIHLNDTNPRSSKRQYAGSAKSLLHITIWTKKDLLDRDGANDPLSAKVM